MEGLFIPFTVKVSLLESCPMDAYNCQTPGKLSEGASKSLTFVQLPSMCPSLRAGPGEGVEWLVERGCCCNVSRLRHIFYFCLSSSEGGVKDVTDEGVKNSPVGEGFGEGVCLGLQVWAHSGLRVRGSQ